MRDLLSFWFYFWVEKHTLDTRKSLWVLSGSASGSSPASVSETAPATADGVGLARGTSMTAGRSMELWAGRVEDAARSWGATDGLGLTVHPVNGWVCGGGVSGEALGMHGRALDVHGRAFGAGAFRTGAHPGGGCPGSGGRFCFVGASTSSSSVMTMVHDEEAGTGRPDDEAAWGMGRLDSVKVLRGDEASWGMGRLDSSMKVLVNGAGVKGVRWKMSLGQRMSTSVHPA